MLENIGLMLNIAFGSFAQAITVLANIFAVVQDRPEEAPEDPPPDDPPLEEVQLVQMQRAGSKPKQFC